MEALSGVASGMAVVSLSIQLIDSVNEIRKLIRNVKGASVELARLAELLTRLAAMLADVCNLLDRQSALQAQVQHVPAASSTIMACLQSCENTLRPLEEFVQKCQIAHDDSTLKQFRKDIRIGLKTKDIAALELRIQQEISFLHTALQTNTNTILVNVLPALLENQQKSALAPVREPQLLAVTQSNDAGHMSSGHELIPSCSQPMFFRRTIETNSALRILGMRQRRSIRYMCTRRSQQGRLLSSHQEDIISEENEYIVSSKLFGLGIRWSHEGVYNRILPSLSVYPVVRRFSQDVAHAFFYADLQQFQKMFASGALHPFTREQWSDRSLLHIAAAFGRADVYQLLLEYGVKSHRSEDGWSPARSTMNTYCRDHYESSSAIDMYRLLLTDFGNIEDLQCQSWVGVHCYGAGVQDMWWLWQQSQHLLFGQELFDFRIILVRAVLVYIARERCKKKRETTLQMWATVITDDFLNEIQTGNFQLLRSLWGDHIRRQSMDSHDEGSVLIGLLSELGIDAHHCISRELDTLTDGILEDDSGWIPYKQIIFEQEANGDWSLRWEWWYEAYGTKAPADTVFSQYEVLATSVNLKEWPFPQWKYRSQTEDMRSEPKWDARFQRRMTAKSRKERARAGLKRPRSKIPGSWVFQ